MERNYPTDEWQRLKEQYAEMSETELIALFDEIGELTETAQRALESEVSRRGLDIRPGDPASRDLAATEQNLVVMVQVWNAADARRAMETLHSAGIPCYLGPDEIIDVDMFLSSFDDGVGLKVRSVDYQRAGAALSRPASPDSANTADEITQCPRCQSPQIGLQQIDEETAAESTQEPKFCWSCDSCGHQWEDTEVGTGF